MKLVFYSLILNHHQAPLADTFYRLLGNNYKFVELRDCKYTKGDNSDYTTRPYLIQAWKSVSYYDEALQLAKSSDVCVFGGVEALPFLKERMKLNLLSFEMGERWLKRGVINLFSPNLLKSSFAYWRGNWREKKIYRLCMSAYAPNDLYFMGQYKNKCFKWGYFTKVDSDFDVETPKKDVSSSEITPIMWCARFLKLKHPELPVQLAARLKAKGYRFTIDMFGSGEDLESIMGLISQLGVDDCVNICGNRPNDEILREMRNHKIFLFTSDRKEGWGAVLNEAMASGCVPVAADEIGSVPFLIKDGYNGMIFKSKNINSLESKVISLFDNKNTLHKMSEEAIKTMQLWSPNAAATRLIALIDALQQGRNAPYENGPCSVALPE